MDVTAGNTEAMLRFHRFHERLNRSIKVQAIGLGLLAEEIDAGVTPEELKERMYARQALWGGMPDWAGAVGDVELAVRDVGQGGVLRAFSAFDLFLDEIEAELSSWRHFAREATDGEGVEIDKDLDRVEKVYLRLGADRSRVSQLWAVYSYFRRARHCIAHREGIASPTLVEAYTSADLQSALDGWIARTGDLTAPAIVPVGVDQPIDFTHRQALAASSVLRLLAMDIGRLVISHLGDRGFVYLVARRAFLDDPPLPETAAGSSMTRVLNYMMDTRYRVRDYSETEGLAALRAIDLTKRCSRRFAQIKAAQGQSGAG